MLVRLEPIHSGYRYSCMHRNAKSMSLFPLSSAAREHYHHYPYCIIALSNMPGINTWLCTDEQHTDSAVLVLFVCESMHVTEWIGLWVFKIERFGVRFPALGVGRGIG